MARNRLRSRRRSRREYDSCPRTLCHCLARARLPTHDGPRHFLRFSLAAPCAPHYATIGRSARLRIPILGRFSIRSRIASPTATGDFFSGNGLSLALLVRRHCRSAHDYASAHSRRPPPALIAQQGQIVDIAKQLGFPPYGRGKHWRLAHIRGNDLFHVGVANARCSCRDCRPLGMVVTILHLTDLHFHGTPDRHFYRAVLDICCAQPTPDLVVLTGDYVDTPRHSRWIVPLLGRLRWQVAGLAILGNHDYWYDPINIRRRLTRCGYLVLGNGWQQLEVRGEPLIVVGQEGPWYGPGPDLSACPAEPFRLCLSHTPDYFPWARRHGMDLVIAGHVHGGRDSRANSRLTVCAEPLQSALRCWHFSSGK